MTFSAVGSAEKPDASVIVLAYRQVARLDSILDELVAHECAATFEVVVVANGVPPDVDAVLEQHGEVSVVRSRVNRGFGGGCNLGVTRARADLVVFLNDDAGIRDGWLDGLVTLMNRHPRVGSAASVLVDENDVVLEAGGAVNHRGDVWPPDRGRPLSTIKGRGPRRASYATGGSLIVRREVFDQVGGFDLAYLPAYFEDADLSCRIWAAGHEVWTTTASVVVHAESASSTSAVKRALQLRNGAIFRGRFTESYRHAGVPTLGPGDELPIPVDHRVLFIDDRAPAPGVGSGAGRARQNLLAIAKCGSTVLFHPREPVADLDGELVGSGIELVENLGAVAPGSVDVVVMSRPHNHDLWDPLLEQHPDARFVYDAEARFSARMERQLELDLTDDERGQIESDLAEMLALERLILSKSDAVVTISTDEKIWFEQNGDADVHWIDPLPDSLPQSDDVDRDRRRAVFVAGWEAGEFSPNGDALKWLATDVMDEIIHRDVDVRIEITGKNPPESLKALENDRLVFVGEVPDLEALLRSARMSLAPTRYGAGVKLKVVDALTAATPVVATTVGGEGIAAPWRDHILIADDPAEFVEAIVSLLEDDNWNTVHSGLTASALAHRADAAGDWREVMRGGASGRDATAMKRREGVREHATR